VNHGNAEFLSQSGRRANTGRTEFEESLSLEIENENDIWKMLALYSMRECLHRGNEREISRKF
jgi:hypothetical protein